MLTYNLSPSFNWDTAGMTDAQMESFIWDLAKFGYGWQFVTLVGFHCDTLMLLTFMTIYLFQFRLAALTSAARITSSCRPTSSTSGASCPRTLPDL